MTGLAQLLVDCDANGIRLLPTGDGRLTIDAPHDVLTPALVDRLKSQKVELLALLAFPADLPAPLAVRSDDVPGLSDTVIDWAMNVWETPREATTSPTRNIKRQPDPPIAWAANVAELIDWYAQNREQLPTAPFMLGPGRRVTGERAFYSSLDRDIKNGPAGVRAVGLGSDLVDLRRICESENAQSRTIDI
jgi:hypothetical protein